ncbi:sigma-54-dependent transcriptional regulator [Limisalsivibrio acetivorans]|uniref:sigma-54-dependent transcriptional regulator n=1 Tax=Limisalsivibrio acetivorans TaxID=1304888 RepID=UPI0003B725D1|nr:sigma-54 dependent transcriptional regulator [Limisalsivibrio acetivorans]
MKNRVNVLVIDDEENILWLFKEGLSDERVNIITADNSVDGLAVLEGESIDICFVDIFLGDVNGIELVREWSEKFPLVHFLIMTAQDTGSNVIESIKSGATDFFPKPFDLVELKNKIYSLSGGKTVSVELDPEVYDYETKNRKMLEIYKLIGKISGANINVLINGESGTGKEVIARMIHEQSNRNDRAFIPINMAAIPSELLESELFGHIKGSFTGAITDKKGKFEEAHHGTIFLDEISEMDFGLQSKLLRVIQEKEITPIGSSRTVNLDTRIIAASNKDLEELVRGSKFREDLFYRLNVVSIDLPPLRERKEDIPYLAGHFLRKHSGIKNRVLALSKESMTALTKYRWPGNIRELENVIQYAIVNSETEEITPSCLPEKLFKTVEESGGGSLSSELSKLASNILESEALAESYNAFEEYMKIVEYPLIKAVLDRTSGNKSVSAKLLGINRNTFRKKVKDHDLE